MVAKRQKDNHPCLWPTDRNVFGRLVNSQQLKGFKVGLLCVYQVFPASLSNRSLSELTALIFNVIEQSQILILHFFVSALTILQSLILLASLHFFFIPLSVYLVPHSFTPHTHILPLFLPCPSPWDEAKVLFCLISSQSSVWGNLQLTALLLTLRANARRMLS